MATAPNIENYYIGKGAVSFKKDGASTYRDLGNVPEFEFTPNIEQLEHYSSREGTKTKDRTVVTTKSGEARIVMDEWDINNLALALLGDVSQDSDGNDVIDIFSVNSVKGALKFVGANEVGPKFQIDLLQVEFIPGNALGMISEEFGQIEVTGQVEAVSGVFGTIKKISEETA